VLLDLGMEQQQTVDRTQYSLQESIVGLSLFHMGVIFFTLRIPTA
jgi:hypothetical protein